MNIIVRTYGSDSCYCRPDTTWERENKDFYSPDCVKEISWCPILFVKISKAGKCIGKKFVSRYYEGLNFGALRYCVTDSENFNLAYTSSADHSSLLPSSLFNLETIEKEDNVFEVRKNGEVIFSTTGKSLIETIENTICKASQLTSIRIGDHIAIELNEISKLIDRNEAEARFKADYCGKNLFDIGVIF
jgi:hypothetical protein